MRISGVPATIPLIHQGGFADSPFIDLISSVEMPNRFTFSSMRLFDGTTDPDNHIAHYKQKMFAVSIPRCQCEACKCIGFGPAWQVPRCSGILVYPIPRSIPSRDFTRSFRSSLRAVANQKTP